MLKTKNSITVYDILRFDCGKEFDWNTRKSLRRPELKPPGTQETKTLFFSLLLFALHVYGACPVSQQRPKSSLASAATFKFSLSQSNLLSLYPRGQENLRGSYSFPLFVCTVIRLFHSCNSEFKKHQVSFKLYSVNLTFTASPNLDPATWVSYASSSKDMKTHEPSQG